MKRRKVLKSLGLGLSAGLIMPQFLDGCKKPDAGPEVKFNGSVAIIGAGVAGLYAADILRSKGVSVVVFEAGSKVGGRIKSYRAPAADAQPTDSFLFYPGNPSIADFPIELGPEVVQGSNSEWGKIISDLTIATVDISTAVNLYVLDTAAKTAADWSADADFNAVGNFVTGLPNVTANGTSVTAASGVSTRGAALLNSLAGNPYGSTSENLDAGTLGESLQLAAKTHDNKTLTLIGTLMQDIVQTRFTNVVGRVKFNTAITAIDYNDGNNITLTDNKGGTTTVQRVIVAVPVSQLKNGSISFSPALPSPMMTSLGKIGMDDCIRLSLDFKSNFWGDKNTGYIFGGTESPQYFAAGYGRSDLNTTLNLTIFGPKATELSAMGKDMLTPILAELDSIYNGAATKYIRQSLPVTDSNGVVTTPAMNLYTIQDWSKEPFINGGFSYPTVGATNDDRSAIAQAINSRVFFAGEATDVSGNAGTINGALASAERVAMEVVTSITG